MFCFVQFDFRYETEGCRYDEIQLGLKGILGKSYWCAKAVGMYSFYNSQLITIIRAQRFDGLCCFILILSQVTRVRLLDHVCENQGLGKTSMMSWPPLQLRILPHLLQHFV